MNRNQKLGVEYSERERSEKTVTVQQAVDAARTRLSGVFPLDLNSIRGRSRKELITIEELNEIADSIVNTSRYWDGK